MGNMKRRVRRLRRKTEGQRRKFMDRYIDDKVENSISLLEILKEERGNRYGKVSA